MSRTAVLLTAVALGFLVAGTARASGRVTLLPTVEALVQNGTSSSYAYLVKFDIPDSVAQGTIVRATLCYVGAGAEGAGGGVIALPLTTAWDPGSANWAWWTENRDQVESAGAASCEGPPAGGGSVCFEVSRAVRGWAATPEGNHGLVVTSSAGAGVVGMPTDLSGSGRPQLVITHRTTMTE